MWNSIDLQAVLEQIASFTSYPCAKSVILAARPSFNKSFIQYQLNLVDQAMQYLKEGHEITIDGQDIKDLIIKAEKQQVLYASQLYAILYMLKQVRIVKQEMSTCHFEDLSEIEQTLDPCSGLYKALDTQIDGQGQIKNDASETLLSLHTKLLDVRQNLARLSRQFLKDNSSKLMESVTTLVDGRVCVLVKAQDKNAFKGMVHGQSSSGQAYYVEPSAFVSYNNQIQSLTSDMEVEKRRICKMLSLMVSKNKVALSSNQESLTLLESTFCKARWANVHQGCVALVQSRDSSLHLERARHPLIDSEKVVANTYHLDDDQKCLMISGPNMGGKTVTLKTIGLFVALSQAGFPILCDRATLPFYDSMFFDIGDQQSIQQNLSTFSAHISNISRICKAASKHSFILLDEIGNGTDPLEGASLACAILKDLIQKESTIITSTHYEQVKAFGQSHDHVLVSSVGFDPQRLVPTYRYIPGVSGASYAFLIAKQYDFDESILDDANFFKEQNESQVQRQMEKLERQLADAKHKQERFEALIQNAHKVQKEADELKASWEKKKHELDTEYAESLNQMLLDKEGQAKAIIKELKKTPGIKMHEQSDKLHMLHSMQETMPEHTPVNVEFKVGDYVRVRDLNTHGEILDIKKKEAMIDTNGMKVKVKLSKLEPMKRPVIKKVAKSTRVEPVSSRFSLELNLIGMHVHEGIEALDDYLDQAIVHHVKQVRIIHGMGTGKLRAAVWKELDKHPSVASKTMAGPSDGGMGATIVTLK